MFFGWVKLIGNLGNSTETNTQPIVDQHTIHIYSLIILFKMVEAVGKSRFAGKPLSIN
jgi:hypothetical protein